ncbi:probable ubiquitin carboxyl-terminal hydrolase MINDY-4 [Pteropus vampyrus]|uniref:Ubiquitin carboxyl-terminal hydrolase MINDY n=1 Tax=Pteropus vampyrus TaxID=132908 RepID=A0A6P6C2D7_PTEVA|nr:probable ubiquitin carboxyl-terminal hydrolase MINDY-4 [Pteropus vampyrus]
MDGLFVEEVAASLVREFLSRKGLKKTCVTMDQERPRSDLSINSRNDLRKLLHLEFLYKENKTQVPPSLEALLHFPRLVPDPSSAGVIPPGESVLMELSLFCRHDSLDGDVLGNLVSSRRPPHKSKPVQMVPAESLPVAPAWEKMDKLQPAEPPLDTRRVGEKVRPKCGLIVRGMMAGPTASSPQDSLRRRSLRRPPALSSMTLPHEEEEESRRALELSTRTPACPAPREGLASSARSPLGPLSEPTSEKHRPTPSSPPHLLSPGLLQRGSGRWRELSEDSPAMDSGPETSRTPSKFLPGGNARTAQERLERVFKRQGSPSLPLRKNQLPVSNKADGELGVLQLEDVEDESIREEVILSPVPSMLKLQIVSKPIDLSVAKDIKTLLFGSSFCCFNEEWKLQSFSFSDAASLKYGIVQNKGGPCGVLAAVQGCVLQKLLFEGDSRADCTRQLQPSNTHRTHCLALAIADIVWRAGGHRRAVVTLASGTQQFSPTGKYKADGVLETVWIHVILGSQLRVSLCWMFSLKEVFPDLPEKAKETHNHCFLLNSGHCLLGLDWPGNGDLDGTPCPGLPCPTCPQRRLRCGQAWHTWQRGKHTEEVSWLSRDNVQFEVGPYGCILLTLSAILSRSTELVRQDFDVPTSHLIGAHGYCTQELVNLLLTGKASSNTFNDVVELDSGNGDVTLLKGIAARSDVGFLSLFEHYNVCQLPRASAKKHHKLGGLKQQKVIVRQFWSTASGVFQRDVRLLDASPRCHVLRSPCVSPFLVRTSVMLD